jgi:hypothetical protein
VPFIAACPHCNRCQLRVPFHRRGDTLPCPRCQREFALVPHPGDEELAAEEAVESPPSVLPVGPTEQVVPGSRLALLPFLAIVLALALCRLPGGRIAAIALAFGGAALAGLSLMDRKYSLRTAWTALVLNGVLMFLLIALPSTLGVEGWWGQPVEEASAEPTWINAGEHGWEEDGVLIELTFALVGAEPSSGQSSRRGLWIGVNVTNHRSTALVVHPGQREATLTSADGIPVAARAAREKARPISVEQGRSLEYMLSFDIPPDTDLLLTLPSPEADGASGARFRIPRELVLGR